jgi:hypothetical protein
MPSGWPSTRPARSPFDDDDETDDECTSELSPPGEVADYAGAEVVFSTGSAFLDLNFLGQVVADVDDEDFAQDVIARRPRHRRAMPADNGRYRRDDDL